MPDCGEAIPLADSAAWEAALDLKAVALFARTSSTGEYLFLVSAPDKSHHAASVAAFAQAAGK